MYVRAVHRSIRTVFVVCVILGLAAVAEAGAYRLENTQEAAVGTNEYKLKVYKYVNMMPVFISEHDYSYVGQQGPPSFIHEWHINLLVYPSGGQSEPVFGKMWYKTSGGTWTESAVQVNGVWEP
jgi:hypothetical protein